MMMISNTATRFERMTARLVARYGGAAGLSRTTTTQATPWDEGTTTTATYSVEIIETGTELDLQEGSLIQAGDLVAAMLPHTDVTPAQLDSLAVGGVTFNVLSVRPVRSDPDGPVIHYILHGRA